MSTTRSTVHARAAARRFSKHRNNLVARMHESREGAGVRRFFTAALLVLGVATPIAQEVPRHVTPNPALSPLAWLAGGRWVASSDDAKAPNLMRESFFEWAANGQALRFWSYTTNRQLVRRPYVDGWYAYHPGRKQITFGYVDAGGYYAGHVTSEGDVLDHIFDGVSNKGTAARFRYTFTKRGPDEMRVNIFEGGDAGWKPVVELTYRRQPF